MSNLSLQQTNMTTNVPPLQKKPYIPYYSSNDVNSNVATNVVTVVNPGIGRGIYWGGPGGPGGNNNPQGQFNPIPYDRPVIDDENDRHGHHWTGASLDLRAHDYHLRVNAKLQTVCCLSTDNMEIKNYKSITIVGSKPAWSSLQRAIC